MASARAQSSETAENAGTAAVARATQAMVASGPSRLARAALIFAAWTVVGLFFFTQDVWRSWFWDGGIPWWRFLLSWLSSTWIFAAMTPGILWLGRRLPLDQRGWAPRAVVHLGASAAVAMAHVAITAYTVPLTGVLGAVTPPTYRKAFGVMLAISLHTTVLTYWMVLAVQHGGRALRRAQEREKTALRLEAAAAALQAQLSRAQLSALKAQLQPHFLFNTLNAIMVLVRQRRVELAEETIARLSDLLRFVLDDVEASEVSLRRELEYLERYLALEQLRFADRLKVEIAVAPELLGAAVPHLGLQPLVENAFRHGIGKSASASLVRVSAARRGEALVIAVEDDGPGPQRDERRAGIGLANTRARLAQLYGEEARLGLAARPGGGARAELVVPFHLAAELPS